MDPWIGLAILIIILIARLIFFKSKRQHDTAEEEKKRRYSENTRRIIATLTEESTPTPPATSVVQERLLPAIFAHFQLVENNPDNVLLGREIMQITQSIPRPHPMINTLMRDMDNSADLFDVVKSDPEIAAKVLQTVNSAGFYLTEKITRLNQAIFFLGTRLVRNIILSVTIQGRIKTDNPSQNKAFSRVWTQGFLASSIGALVARHLMLENASELSTQALLLGIGDIGIIAYQAELANHYINIKSMIARVIEIQNRIKVNAQVVGGVLAQEWELPATLTNVIQNILVPMVVAPESCRLDEKTLKDTVFCYAMALVADSIIVNQLEDVADVKIVGNDEPEYYYLSEYLTKTALDKIVTTFHDPLFRKNANQILKQMPINN